MINSIDRADLSTLNTLALPCIARKLIKVHSIEALQRVCETYEHTEEQMLILGGGSNLVLPPYLDRTVIQYSGLSSPDYYKTESGDVLVEADAGLCWDELVEEVVGRGLHGIENLSMIPGTVGAAPVQNIGAYGVELAELLEWVQVYHFASGEVERLENNQCEFAYRDSLFKQNPGERLILKICLKLSVHKSFTLSYGELKVLSDAQSLTGKDVRDKVMSLRRAKIPDPDELANAGSFFKNPLVSDAQFEKLKSEFPSIVSYPLSDGRAKLAAGWLIDQAGWKGYRSGAVGVHTSQALVLVNYGGATRAGLLELAADIQASILEKFGVSLDIEPVVID